MTDLIVFLEDLALAPFRFASWWMGHLQFLVILVLVGVVLAPSLSLAPRGRQLPAWAGAVGVGVWLAGWWWVL